MKRSLALFLALTALMLCGCKAGPVSTAAVTEPPSSPSPSAAPVKTTEGALCFFENSNYIQQSGDDGLICRAEFPALSPDSRHAAAFPELSAAIDSLNADFAAGGNSAYQRLLRMAESDIELGTETVFPYTRTVKLYMPRADGRAVSILVRETEYSGGAQELIGYRSYNFDSRTGRALKLENVVGDASLLPALLETALTEKYPKAEFYSLPDSLAGFMGENGAEFAWTLDYQGLSFYFAPYELAPYEEGSFSVSLRFDEHSGLASTYYTLTPHSFAIPLVEGECLGYDMDGNGIADVISVRGVKSKNGDRLESLAISVNGKQSSVNVNIQDFEAYVAHTGPGKNFLIINAVNSGFGYISAYRLDKSGATLSGMLYDTSLQAAGHSGRFFGKPLLTCPEYFPLGTKIELLGTLTGLKSYRIGNTGLPETADELYELSGGAPLRAVSSFSTATLDSSTGQGNFATLKIVPGTELYFWRSDGAGLVDMYTASGELCRFYVSGKPGGQRVNGMAAESCFEGMVYLP